MTERIRDLPHLRKLRLQRRLIGGVHTLARMVRPALRLIGKDVPSLDRKMSRWREAERIGKDLESIPDKFNKFFGPRGWIFHEQADLKLASTCVEKAEYGDVDGAERDWLESFTAECVRFHLMRMNEIQAFYPRMGLAEKALADFEEGRFYASVLVTLSLLDGLVNDLHVRKVGFFSKEVELSAWDSISAHSTGLKSLSKIMTQARTKTRVEPIDLPYRHGIVHGRDLGYDNKIVAAKAWAALFATRDWAIKAENNLLDGPPTEERETLSALLSRYANSKKEEEELDRLRAAWIPRIIRMGEDYPENAKPDDMRDGTPEHVALKFCSFAKSRNFGGFVELLPKKILEGGTVKALAGEFRKRLANTQITEIALLEVVDETSAVSVVTVRLAGVYRAEPFNESVKMRLGHVNSRDRYVPQGATGGKWQLLGVPSQFPIDPIEEND